MLVSFFMNYTILYEIFCFMNNTLRIVSFIAYPKVYVVKMTFVSISGVKDITNLLRNLQLSSAAKLQMDTLFGAP